MTASALPSISSSLALWPGLFLVAGGFAKAADVAGGELRDTVAARLIGGRRRLRAFWGLAAAAELAVGALVVGGLAVPWPEAAAAALLGGAGLLALWGLRHAPDAGCGCFGARGSAPVSVRTVLRAGFLAALAAGAAVGGASWASVFDDGVAAALTVAAGVVLGWLSPDLRAEAVGRASLGARSLRDAACGRQISIDRTVARLRSSELWRRARPYVSAETPTEHWDEGCWRLLCYPAVYEGEPATAVFSIRLGLRPTPDTVAFVDEAERRVLGRLEARRLRA